MNPNTPMTREELLEIRRVLITHRDQAERQARRPKTKSYKARHLKKAAKKAAHHQAYIGYLDEQLRALNEHQVVNIGGLPGDVVSDVKHINP